MMRTLFNPNDALARCQWLCLVLIAVMVCVSGAFQ